MKILHLCLANFYIDDFGYQENILPKMHMLQGHVVEIVASTETYMKDMTLGYVDPGSYLNRDKIPVRRIPYSSIFPSRIGRKIRVYVSLLGELERFRPDIIFIHDCQFWNVVEVVRYARENFVRIYVDCHTDYINSARNFFSRNLLHKILYRYYVSRIEPYVSMFYGTLPLRNDFLREVYKVPESKISLLPLGVDDSLFEWVDRDRIRVEKRDEMGISCDEFVLITGGKIDERKKIHVLVEVLCDLWRSGQLEKVRLLLLGKPVPEMERVFEKFSSMDEVICAGWVSPSEIHEYVFSADLAVFPGTHSVLWEQVVGLGLPVICKKWVGIEHLDLGGNCEFICSFEKDSIERTLLSVIRDKSKFESMKRTALELGPKMFCYSDIAMRAIEGKGVHDKLHK